MILLEQSFTACMLLLTVTSALELGKRCWGSPQWCYMLHHLCTTTQLMLSCVKMTSKQIIRQQLN